MRLFPLEPERLGDVLVGGQYGSKGKGNVCAYLAKDYEVLVRVGGPDAGHTRGPVSRAYLAVDKHPPIENFDP